MEAIAVLLARGDSAAHGCECAFSGARDPDDRDHDISGSDWCTVSTALSYWSCAVLERGFNEIGRGMGCCSGRHRDCLLR